MVKSSFPGKGAYEHTRRRSSLSRMFGEHSAVPQASSYAVKSSFCLNKRGFATKNCCHTSSHCSVQVGVEEEYNNVGNTCGKTKTTAEKGEKAAQFVVWEAMGSMLA